MQQCGHAVDAEFCKIMYYLNVLYIIFQFHKETIKDGNTESTGKDSNGGTGEGRTPEGEPKDKGGDDM